MKTRIIILNVFVVLCLHISGQWTLQWSDEFDYTGAPDPDDWNTEIWTPGWVNEELQAYTDRSENVRVENGILIIEARRDFWNDYEYTSARIQTSHKHDALYGRIEVKAILPEGRGTWPAIWMLPSDWVYGGWPTCGEIDIMEHVGYDPGVIHASIHTESYNHTINTQVTEQITVSDFNTAYHVYALEWTPTDIKMFVDDTHYFTFINEETGYREWPFDKPFHVILNIAVGGTWGGARGVDRRIWPQQMVVDYVRFYEGDFGTDNTAPTTPVNLSGTGSSSSVTLTWLPSDDDFSVKEYVVYVDNTLAGTTIWHDYNVSGLLPLTSYEFQVLARDYSGNESAFAVTTVTTTDIITVTIPAKIEAEDFDAQFGTDTELATDEGGGLNVGWIDAGDWLDYVVDPATAGSYIIDYRIAAMSAEGEIALKNEAGSTLVTTSLPVTGDWQSWTTVSSDPFDLPAGPQRLRVYANIGGFNLNWLEFRSVDPSNDTEPPTAPANLSAVMTTTTADLAWDASTDNVAVAGYNVLVNGSFAGTTSGLTYHIDGLTKRTAYTFSVIAFDPAGNESEPGTLSTRTKPKDSETYNVLTDADYTIYPMPANGEINIIHNDDIYLINLLDLTGRVVKSVPVSGTFTQIQTTELSNGIFLIELISEDYATFEKIIIE
ncbi:MAG: family 16 glycosylhydrolase [Bacteroidales bacterium]|nr:family 16 glycosylhydrolase [Bacteroidales bacterium]